MQKYVTDVFAYDFAYGARFALEGKRFILSFTCCGEKSYTRDGLYHCTINEIMLPIYATARYCKLNYLGNVVSYDMMLEDCPVDRIRAKAQTHGERGAEMARGSKNA